MTGLNVDWALAELEKFINQTVLTNNSGSYGGVSLITSRASTAAPDGEVTKRAQVVEKIFDRVLPQWRNIDVGKKTNRWEQHRETAIRAKEELLRQEEIRQNLGDGAPEISAASLHPWVWSGAASLWKSGHFRSAVEDAAKKINAETQNKVNRRDVSETDLFKQSFSLDAPATGKPRLRRMADDGSDTYRSMQRGAMALAEGVYAGIRNPFGHGDPRDVDEQVALEYLAAPSALARWVDEASVESAS